MKLPKSLLGALLIGIAVQSASSCTKDKNISEEKLKKAAQEKEEAKNNPDYCPACGMG